MSGRNLKWMLGLIGLLLLGCADVTEPITAAETRPHTATASNAEAPSYRSLAEVPNYMKRPWVYVRNHRVSWAANVANGYGSMEYSGNRASITHNLTIIHRYSTVLSKTVTLPGPDWYIPGKGLLGVPIRATLSETCGQTADLDTRFEARNVVLIQSNLTTVGSAVSNRYADARQPDCSCNGDPPALHSVDYGPVR